MTHERYHRTVWASKSDFTAALAKWLVKQSPYTVPDNLKVCLEKFDAKLAGAFSFDENDMVQINLLDLAHEINEILEQVPEVMALNERRNGKQGIQFVDRYSSNPAADDDFICILAVAQNITCEFAERADAEAWLERDVSGGT